MDILIWIYSILYYFIAKFWIFCQCFYDMIRIKHKRILGECAGHTIDCCPWSNKTIERWEYKYWYLQYLQKLGPKRRRSTEYDDTLWDAYESEDAMDYVDFVKKASGMMNPEARKWMFDQGRTSFSIFC